MSYAIYWYVSELAPRYAGRLELTESSVELSGSALGNRFLASIAFEDIASVRLSAGRLRIRRRGGAALELGSVDGPGSLREVAERLASVVPLAAVSPVD
jgi:hypothetical protein